MTLKLGDKAVLSLDL